MVPIRIFCCLQIGDSIVRKARETLERAIKQVEDTPKWAARVVYGDTDRCSARSQYVAVYDVSITTKYASATQLF